MTRLARYLVPGLVAFGLAGCAAPRVSLAPTPPAPPPPTLGEAVEAVVVADSTVAPEVTAAPPADTDSTTTPPAPESEVVAAYGEWELRGTSLESVSGGKVIAVDEPVITHGDVLITAEEGWYYRDEQRAELEGNVVFTEPDLVGRCLRAEYFEATRLLLAHEDVHVEGDSLEVRAAEGLYDRRDRVINLEGGVQGRHGHRVFAARSAVWRRDTGLLELTGGVRVDDEIENATLTGEHLFYDLETSRARVTQEPGLVLRNQSGSDMRIVGERMILDPGGNAFVGGDVRVFRGGVSAFSDSASFFRSRHEAVLLGSPRVREADGTLTGDTLVLHFDEGEALTRADVIGNALVRYVPVDSLHVGEESTVRGDSLSMHFGEAGAERVVTVGRAASSYRPPPREMALGAGTNAAEGDTITIFLVEGRVERVTVEGRGSGVYRFGTLESAADTTVADTLTVDTTAADTTAADTLAAMADSLGAPFDSTGADTAEVPAPEGRERVEYAGNRIEYDMPNRVVDLLGEARVEYGALVLTAGKIRFWADRRVLDAEDNPVLVEAGEDRTVVGERMGYNLDSGEGTIDGGRTEAENGTITADRLRQVGDGQFIARGARYTTCELAEHGEAPHYHFASRKMRIYMKDKVVARPVVLYIRDIPILPVPFYVFSIRKGRHSGLLVPDFNFGLTGDSGPFFRNLGYYWAASDYYDFFFRADYQQDPSRFVGRIDARYAKRYLMQGEVGVAQSFGSTSGHDITGAHRMTLGEWSLTGRAEFRDQAFRRDEPLGTDFGVRLDRFLTSDVSVSRSFPFGASFSLTAKREEDLDARDNTSGNDVILTETLPSYNFSLNSRPVGRAPDADGNGGRLPFLSNLRFSFNTSGSSVLTERERTTISFADTSGGFPPDTTLAVNQDRVSGARHRLSLSDSRRIMDAFNVGVGVNANETWVDREFTPTDTLDGFARAATWNASARVGTAAYGTVGGLGPVEAIRHTLEPSASLTYQPSFDGLTYVDTAGIQRNRYPGVSATESRFLSLSLNQRVQAKLRSGDVVRRVDVLNWRLGTSYDLVAADHGERAWNDIQSEVDLNRILGVDLRFNSSHDPYVNARFKTFQLTGSFTLRGSLPGGDADVGTEGESPDSSGLQEQRQDDWTEAGADLASRSRDPSGRPLRGAGGGWNLGFTLSHAGSRDLTEELQTTTSVNASGSVQITRNWSVQYQGRWDLEEGDLLGEGITLRRDLHCWEAEFTRSRLGDDTSFYFRINVKSMPDVKYEQGEQGGTGFNDLTRLIP